MAMKTATEVTSVPQQTEVVIEAAEVKIPAEIKEKGQVFIDRMVKQMEDQTEAYAMRSAVEIEAGTPLLPGGYQYWNCLTLGPVPLGGPPPWQPSKIIAAGDPCLMLGLIWVNPALGPGASLPGTIVLGGRPFQARFESINLTTVTDGPDFTFPGTFLSPAQVVFPVPWYMFAPDPGPNPALYEVNFTADVTLGGQPFASFSTWHYDYNNEPPFLGRPPVPPQWQYERPARILVYRR